MFLFCFEWKTRSCERRMLQGWWSIQFRNIDYAYKITFYVVSFKNSLKNNFIWRIHKATAGAPPLFLPSSPSEQLNLAHTLYTATTPLELCTPMEAYMPFCHLYGGSVFRVPSAHLSASGSGRKSWPGRLFQCGVPFHSNRPCPIPFTVRKNPVSLAWH